MKKFVFELTLTERELEGDEFWEEALEKDGTGITTLTESVIYAVTNTILPTLSEEEVGELIKLKSYTEE